MAVDRILRNDVCELCLIQVHSCNPLITLQLEIHSSKLIIKPSKVGAFSGALAKDYLLASDTVTFDRCCYVSGACKQWAIAAVLHWPSIFCMCSQRVWHYTTLADYPASLGFPIMHRVYAICTQS